MYGICFDSENMHNSIWNEERQINVKSQVQDFVFFDIASTPAADAKIIQLEGWDNNRFL